MSSQDYIEGLLEMGAESENPRFRRMVSQCVDAIDRGFTSPVWKGSS